MELNEAHESEQATRKDRRDKAKEETTTNQPIINIKGLSSRVSPVVTPFDRPFRAPPLFFVSLVRLFATVTATLICGSRTIRWLRR